MGERKWTSDSLDLLLHVTHRQAKRTGCSDESKSCWKFVPIKNRPDASQTIKKLRMAVFVFVDKIAQPPTSQFQGPVGTSKATQSPWFPIENRDTRPLLPQHKRRVPSLEAAPVILSPTSGTTSIVFVLVIEKSTDESLQCSETLAHLSPERVSASSASTLALTQTAHQLPSGGAAQKPDGVAVLTAETIGFGVLPNSGLTSQRRNVINAVR